MRALVVVPTYNESENITELVHQILHQGDNFNVLIIDDNSPDGTGALADKLVEILPNRVAVMHRPGKMGLGSAYVAGFKHGLEHGYECVIEMDADFSHSPSVLPEFVNKMHVYDLVVGSRYVQGISVVNWDLWRLALSKWASFYTRKITRIPLTDPMGGYKGFHRRVLEVMPLDDIKSNGYSFQLEMNYRTWKKGFRITEIPIIFYERRQGQSKMSKKVILEAVFLPWKLLFMRS